MTFFSPVKNKSSMKKWICLIGFAGFVANLYAQMESSPGPTFDIVERRHFQENRPLPYPPLRESDLLWEKNVWRVVDTREKMNLPFRYPPRPLFTILAEGVQSGRLTAYSVEDDRFSSPLEVSDVNRMLYHVDTVPIYDIDSGTENYQVVASEINVEDIKRYRLREVWYFDSNTSSLKVRILGIAPLKEEYDDNGNFKYERPLFWLYYPQCRELLSKEKAPNPFNDHSLISWEGLFEMRFFSSYIMKASNLQDARLEEYYSGVDLLMESERIEQSIFNFESDMWQY